MMIKKFFLLSFLFAFYSLLLPHASVSASYPEFTAALQEDTQLLIQLDSILMKDALHFIKQCGESLSLPNIQQLIVSTLETLPSTLNYLDLPVKQHQSRTQCLQNINHLPLLINEPYLEKIRLLSIRGAFKFTLQETLKLTSSLKSPQHLESKVPDFLQNLSKNKQDLINKSLALKLLREVKFIEKISPLIFEGPFKQPELAQLILRLFESGLRILARLENENDTAEESDLTTYSTEILKGLGFIRELTDNPQTSIGRQLAFPHHHYNNQEWMDEVKKLYPPEQEVPEAIKRSLSQIIAGLQNDYDKVLAHLSNVPSRSLNSHPDDNLYEESLDADLAQTDSPHQAPSDHNPNLKQRPLKINSEFRPREELAYDNGGPSQPLSKRPRIDTRIAPPPKSPHAWIGSSSSFLPPALEEPHAEASEHDQLALALNPSAEPEREVLRLEGDKPADTDSLTSTLSKNRHKEPFKDFTSDALRITKSIETGRRDTSNQYWFNKIKKLGVLQINTKKPLGKSTLVRDFCAQIGKENPLKNAGKDIWHFLSKFLHEELFLFFINASFCPEIDTLDADALTKAWRKHLESKELIGEIWEKTALDMIQKFNEITRLFISYAQQGIWCDILTLAKEKDFPKNKTHLPTCHAIIKLILKTQQAIILKKIRPTTLINPQGVPNVITPHSYATESPPSSLHLALPGRLLTPNHPLAAQPSNPNIQTLIEPKATPEKIESKILATKTNPKRIAWIGRIKEFALAQLEAKMGNQQAIDGRAFCKKVGKRENIAISETALYVHHKRIIIEEFFLFFLSASRSAHISTLDGNTLRTAWANHLQSEGLTGQFWNKKADQIIEGLINTTTSFISNTQAGIPCNIFELAKTCKFTISHHSALSLHKDIIATVLKLQQAKILMNQLQSQLVQPIPTFQQPFGLPSEPQRQLPFLLPFAPLENVSHLTQTQIDLLNPQTGVRL
jgi:hypothetical protein